MSRAGIYMWLAATLIVSFCFGIKVISLANAQFNGCPPGFCNKGAAAPPPSADCIESLTGVEDVPICTTTPCARNARDRQPQSAQEHQNDHSQRL